VFDMVIFDEHNQVLAEIEGFTMRRIDTSARVGIDESSADSASSISGANLIDEDEPLGIFPSEGAQMLTRLLQAALPTSAVVVSQPIEVPDEPKPLSPKVEKSTSDPGRQDVEHTLSTWWSELLGVEQIGIDDDFFSLGGHSLVGVRLFAKIKNTYHVDLEIALLFEARTVRLLAAAIRQVQQLASREKRSTLIAVQPKGKETPIFLVHAVGGDVVFYEPLARALGPDQPVYAFQSPLIARSKIHETSIDELASTYVREMRAFYPNGPYLIGGSSFGGLVAFEMAKLLKMQGADPGLVVLLDSLVPGHENGAAFLSRAFAFYRHFRKQGVQCLIRRIKIEYRHRAKQLLREILILSCIGSRWTGRPLPLRLRYVEIDEAHRKALARHVFTPYSGKVTLIRAAVDRGSERLCLQRDPTLGWGSLASGGVTIHDISAGHNDILVEPKVASLAHVIKRSISHR